MITHSLEGDDAMDGIRNDWMGALMNGNDLPLRTKDLDPTTPH